MPRAPRAIAMPLPKSPPAGDARQAPARKQDADAARRGAQSAARGAVRAIASGPSSSRRRDGARVESSSVASARAARAPRAIAAPAGWEPARDAAIATFATAVLDGTEAATTARADVPRVHVSLSRGGGVSTTLVRFEQRRAGVPSPAAAEGLAAVSSPHRDAPAAGPSHERDVASISRGAATDAGPAHVMMTMHTGDPVLFEERPGFALRESGAEILARPSAAFVAGPATTESPDAIATETPTAKNTTVPEPAMSLEY